MHPHKLRDSGRVAVYCDRERSSSGDAPAAVPMILRLLMWSPLFAGLAAVAAGAAGRVAA